MRAKALTGESGSALAKAITGPPNSRFVQHIDRLMNDSPKKQNEIAREIGYEKPNIITMFKQGTTRVPVDRVPLLADSLGVDRVELLNMWLEEYQPVLFEVLNQNLGIRLSRTERTWVRGLRKILPNGLPPFDETAQAIIQEAVERNPEWSKLDKATAEKDAALLEVKAANRGE
jgi:hypothetical protein